MNNEISVTIRSTLHDRDISSMSTFQHPEVLDLRKCAQNGPRPIEEIVLKKLANFQVSYEQMPTKIGARTSQAHTNFLGNISQKRGDILVLTDEPARLERLCNQKSITCTNRDLHVVADGHGNVSGAAIACNRSAHQVRQVAA